MREKDKEGGGGGRKKLRHGKRGGVQFLLFFKRDLTWKTFTRKKKR